MDTTLTDHGEIVASLAWTTPSGGNRQRGLREGDCLAVGSDSSADIYLEQEGVSGTHCVIRVQSGEISIRDCFSAVGTHVNGQRITEVLVNTDARIRTGQCEIQLAVTEAFRQNTKRNDKERSALEMIAKLKAEIGATDQEAVEHEEATPLAETLHFGESGPLESVPEQHASGVFELPDASETESSSGSDELPGQLEEALAELEVLRERLAARDSEPRTAAPADAFHADMLDILRAEVLELQAEVQERDLRIADLRKTQADADPVEDGDLSNAAVARLEERLDQLLSELQSRDEQVGLLEDLLRSAEEANSAEQEERVQLEKWVKDIENRFGQREEEWNAEVEKLLERINALIAEREQAEVVMSSNSSSAREEALQRISQSQREDAERCRAELQEVQQRNQQLQRELEKQHNEARELVLSISQERAEVARMRHEFESRRKHVEEDSTIKESDDRIRALRQHLREVHEEEAKERQERSLSNRLSRLWKRLDG